MKIMILVSLLFAATVVGQQKYLITPNDDYIPLRKGQSASSVIAKRSGRSSPSSTSATCGTRFEFGYPPDRGYPSAVNHVGRHKDVMGEWFVAKASGTIDTLFWDVQTPVGAKDSTLYIRIHNSRIGPGYGPGIHNDSTSYPPPCQNWGYFVNTNDQDQGVQLPTRV